MNFLILGNGAEERDWARAIIGHPEHRLQAAYPGFDEFSMVHRPTDLDDALAVAEFEAVVVGGPIEQRAEALRRAAAVGLPVICLHPPGDDSEAYYQVALSRDETGSIVVPDLPARLHPGVEALRHAWDQKELGAFRELRYELSAAPEEGDLTRHVFARAVDVVRALLGEVEAVTATGDPPGERPTLSLVVHLRGPESRRAEIRVGTVPGEPARLTLIGAEGSLTLEYQPTRDAPARLVRRTRARGETVTELNRWNPHDAILATLTDAFVGRDVHPNLGDGTRAMELSEATVRSLRRRRTIELSYEDISEEGTFKSVMTSVGCVILLSILIALPAALVGPALGIPWTLYIAYAIPPALVIFILLQLLRFLILEKRSRSEESTEEFRTS